MCSGSHHCRRRQDGDPGYNWQEYIKWHMLMLARDASLLLFYLFRRGNLNPSAFYLCQISHMMFKKKAVGKMRFDYKYRYGGEDWDFISRVLEKGNIRIISGRLTIFRYSYNSSTVNPINKINKWKSYLQLGESLPSQMKKSFYYKLFLQYIALFKPRN